MNEDFEEDYEEDDDDGSEDLERAKDKAKEAKDKYDQQKGKKNQPKADSDPTQHNQARDFDKSLKDKNVARSNNPNAGQQVGQEAAKKGGQEAAKQAGTQAATTGATSGAAAGGAAAGGAAAGGAAAGGAAAGGAAAGGAAAGGAAAAGGVAAAGGAVAAQAAIPVAGWIALAVEAVIAAAIALHKMQKKRDKKNAEYGVDSKNLRRLAIATPVLFPVAVGFMIIFIIIALIQGETYDKVEFMQKAIECFESDGGCWDFMNTGIPIGNGVISTEAEPLIRKTDLEIAEFVAFYKIAEWKYFGSVRFQFYV